MKYQNINVVCGGFADQFQIGYDENNHQKFIDDLVNFGIDIGQHELNCGFDDSDEFVQIVIEFWSDKGYEIRKMPV